jgi:uncharacterized protein YcfJ
MAVKKKTVKKKVAKKGRKGGMSTMVAGAAGAVVGAALGGAAGAALAHGRTRKALSDTASNIGEYASDTIRENREAISEVTGAVVDRPSKRSKKSAK